MASFVSDGPFVDESHEVVQATSSVHAKVLQLCAALVRGAAF